MSEGEKASLRDHNVSVTAISDMPAEKLRMLIGVLRDMSNPAHGQTNHDPKRKDAET